MERMVEESDLDKLPYLNMVIKETLRLHPVAPLLLPHAAIEECTVNGFHIPKNSRVFINAWTIGRDPEYWDEPEKFFPERFSGNNIDYIGRDFEFIPFGSGRRSCPGMQLGMIVVRLMVAQIVHCFDWELPNGMVSSELDMNEEFGLTIPRSTHLVAIPSYRLKKSFFSFKISLIKSFEGYLLISTTKIWPLMSHVVNKSIPLVLNTQMKMTNWLWKRVHENATWSDCGEANENQKKTFHLGPKGYPLLGSLNILGEHCYRDMQKLSQNIWSNMRLGLIPAIVVSSPMRLLSFFSGLVILFSPLDHLDGAATYVLGAKELVICSILYSLLARHDIINTKTRLISTNRLV
ncbi:hypothetical protein F8388_025793 [Cannabis sativa]|uniref:Cytochrome P450 n=1 Tax=Cannabis sativa TaxID=3483 RepID=A0A7J6F9T1_CANSA|nr:hypothetical protein F8388_025793 [Cannabis sativa]